MTDLPAHFALGPARHEVTVRGLTEQEFIGASRRLMAAVRKDLRSSPAKTILYLAAMLAVGMLIGFLVSYTGFFARLVVAYGRPPQTTLFRGWSLLLIAGAILVAGIAMQVLAVMYWQKKLYRKSVASIRTFALPQHLTFADNGLGAACEAGLTAVPWSRITHRFNHANLQFIIIDNAMMFWLPQTDLDAAPGLAQFLDEKSPVPLQ